MKKQFILLCSILSIGLISTSCEKTETPACFEELGIRNCNELFDSIQANLSDPSTVAEYQRCAKENCN